MNSSGSQLIGVRYVQVGLEERENLTVTWNVSIAIRSLCVTLLAATLALVLVVTLAQDADAKHKKRRKKGVADFALVFHHCEPRFTPEDNRLLFWAIGTHLGVARPQGKASQLMSLRSVGVLPMANASR